MMRCSESAVQPQPVAHRTFSPTLVVSLQFVIQVRTDAKARKEPRRGALVDQWQKMSEAERFPPLFAARCRVGTRIITGINQFARDLGILEGEVSCEQVVATRFAALRVSH
jgi:hypothetical protein